jgi:hypothetical protein
MRPARIWREVTARHTPDSILTGLKSWPAYHVLDEEERRQLLVNELDRTNTSGGFGSGGGLETSRFEVSFSAALNRRR